MGNVGLVVAMLAAGIEAAPNVGAATAGAGVPKPKDKDAAGCCVGGAGCCADGVPNPKPVLAAVVCGVPNDSGALVAAGEPNDSDPDNPKLPVPNVGAGMVEVVGVPNVSVFVLAGALKRQYAHKTK